MRIAIIREVANLRYPSHRWCLQWRTETMPAPAFTYYETRSQAVAQAHAMGVTPTFDTRTPREMGERA